MQLTRAWCLSLFAGEAGARYGYWLPPGQRQGGTAQTVKMIPLMLMSSSGSPGKLAVAAAGIRSLISSYAGTKKLASFFQNSITR
jgi:hypothetical protein